MFTKQFPYIPPFEVSDYSPDSYIDTRDISNAPLEELELEVWDITYVVSYFPKDKYFKAKAMYACMAHEDVEVLRDLEPDREALDKAIIKKFKELNEL